MRWPVAPLVLFLGLSGTPLLGSAQVVYAEIEPGIGVSVELAGVGALQEEVVFSLYFLSDEGPLEAEVVLPGNRTRTRRVLEVAEGDPRAVAALERCEVVTAELRCRTVDEGVSLEIARDGDERGILVELAIAPQGIDWGEEELRLTMEAGRFLLNAAGPQEPADLRESPAIVQASLPSLSDLERRYLEQIPVLHLDVSPLVRAETVPGGGFQDLGLAFDGGVYRVTAGGNTRLQLTWEGEVATSDSASFNHIAADAGLTRNLRPNDWLPLTLTVRGEGDRRFDAFDVAANARLGFIVPFNPTLQTGAYRPAIAPRIEVLAALGSSLRSPDSALEGTFARLGYGVRWRVPLGEASVLHLRHAGIWNDPQVLPAAWHLLWDVRIDVEIAGVTYFVGYQDGEASPLFEPIQTSRIGFSFAIADPG